MKNKEITWSLFHPVEINTQYMQKVINMAKNSDVDSFEICGACHASHLGGLDGLAFYDENRKIHDANTILEMKKNIDTLNQIIDMAHSIDKEVYYWHREVTIPERLMEENKALLDSNGEFDLLGEAYKEFLEEKILQAFNSVPNLDGIVLTLTESDYSTIHNSTPDIYPPVEVVNRITSIFAKICKMKNKRLILRSFGSIKKDYEDIIAGAKIAAKEFDFEIETKITPYDFNPFLSENPFLNTIDNLSLGAECDCLGEFLGAGFLPAENVDNIVKYVRFAEQRNVDRFAIRLDRKGNNIFDTYPINLFAYTQAILNPQATAESIKKDYTEKFYPKNVGSELISLGELGFEMVKHMNYVDGNLIFHSFPLTPDLKMVKAGGIFSCFTNNISLERLTGIWSILTQKSTIGRQNIIEEKLLAVNMADEGMKRLNAIKEQLPKDLFERNLRLWTNAKTASTSILYLCKCIKSYFDSMALRLEEPKDLIANIEKTKLELSKYLVDKTLQKVSSSFINGIGSPHGEVDDSSNLDNIYLKPIIGMTEILLEEYYIEIKMRKFYEKENIKECIIAGSIVDDYLCNRYMHASYVRVFENKLERFVGNQVFPNGYIEYDFSNGGTLKIHGKGNGLKITINSELKFYSFDNDMIVLNIPDNSTIKLQKQGVEYPVIWAITLE